MSTVEQYTWATFMFCFGLFINTLMIGKFIKFIIHIFIILTWLIIMSSHSYYIFSASITGTGTSRKSTANFRRLLPRPRNHNKPFFPAAPPPPPLPRPILMSRKIN